MKKTFILAALVTTALSLQAHAADTLSTSQDFKTLKVTPSTETTATVQAPAQTTAKASVKPGLVKGGAHIVPDTSPPKAPVAGNALKKSDQGYSKAAAYNVVNDENKPVTQDWTRPQSWRIGYKNKNRTPINE